MLAKVEPLISAIPALISSSSGAHIDRLPHVSATWTLGEKNTRIVQDPEVGCCYMGDGDGVGSLKHAGSHVKTAAAVVQSWKRHLRADQCCATIHSGCCCC
jgi:hypothetical protein